MGRINFGSNVRSGLIRRQQSGKKRKLRTLTSVSGNMIIIDVGLVQIFIISGIKLDVNV